MSKFARDEDGDIVLPTVGSGEGALVTDPAECLLLKIPDVLYMVKGEYFLDTSKGFPWQTYLGQKNPNLPQFKADVRKALGAIPTVASVTDVSASFDPATRNLTAGWDVADILGNTVSGP